MSGASASSTPPEGTEGQVELGYVAGAHALRGQIKVKLHSATTEALTPGVALCFRVRGGGPVVERLTLNAAELDASGKAEARLTLEGVDDRNAAEALKGTGIWIAREDMPILDDDEYYLADLIGMRARHALVDLSLGKVIAVTSNGAQDLLELAWRDEGGRVRKWLCPAIPGIVIETGPDLLLLDPVQGFMPEGLEAAFAELYDGDESPTEG